MSDLADHGYGVLFSSSELAEVMGMADRIVVMAKGRITGRFRADDVTEEQLVTASASDQILESIQ